MATDPETLLPRNQTDFEASVSRATDPAPKVANALAAYRTQKLVSPPPDWLPFLVYEYGLGELSPYLPNLYSLIDAGIDWQRVRGTPDAIGRGLGWLTYAASQIEEMPTRYRWWSRFMVELDRVRDADTPDLRRIDGVVNLSAPLRSVFWRGWRGYDVRALEFSYGRLGQTMLSTHSGVRIPTVSAKWSFGRRHENTHAMTQAELTQLGIWIAPGSTSLPWGNFKWNSTTATWADPSEQTRRNTIAGGMVGRPVWLELRDAGGAVIGYRRARALHRVTLDGAGQYPIGNDRYAVDNAGGTNVLVEAMTDFGDGGSAAVASWGWVWDATPVDAGRPGLLWAGPADLAGVTAPVGVKTETTTLGKTIRERYTALLTIP